MVSSAEIDTPAVSISLMFEVFDFLHCCHSLDLGWLSHQVAGNLLTVVSVPGNVSGTEMRSKCVRISLKYSKLSSNKLGFFVFICCRSILLIISFEFSE